ncbi:hypothetical protein CK203_113352 [Vitis vinifera]|uniref:Uncharacterized protein n=1 Tax=Vitis vinifera TaxID=29760 RepID=A0A438CA04_VITVI|nr:hypothetical protein CK203_113352 [Vitis vinifera]
MLYYERWPPCVLIRTSILLSFVRFGSIWDFCHHLSLTFLTIRAIASAEETIPAKETTRSYVPIQPTQEATTNASFSHDPTTT